MADPSAPTRLPRRRRGILPILGSLLAVTGCSSLPFSDDALPHCPVALVPSEDLEPGLRMRLRFHVTTPESSLRVEASLETQDGKLMVAGFTPFGTPAFAITQEGSEVVVEEHFGRHEGVRPVLILDALHRTLLLPSAGESPWSWGEERVEEQRSGGRVVRRIFRAIEAQQQAGTEPGERRGARVEYRVHEQVEAFEVENLWCPYEARFVILASNRPIAADGAP